jgi:pimeloyl-ACP methyl ester carboxylesterase
MWMTGGGVRLLERSRPGVLHNDLNACNEYRHGLDTAAKITCPVHLVLGREDVMAPPRATRELVATLSVVRVVELADCGHMLMAEQPDAVRDALVAAFPAPAG